MKSKSETSKGNDLRFIFYIAGDGACTRQARLNLESLIEELGKTVKVDVIDVTKQPELALAEGVFTTPALIAIVGSARIRFIGDLSQREKVISALI